MQALGSNYQGAMLLLEFSSGTEGYTGGHFPLRLNLPAIVGTVIQIV